ncbi:MAG: GDSL-type esterase/lipase family protein [Capsulimonadaceae bacterium]|nr:GDSL-type esterase/lipase family protein [Capsulimonadaceae bacterium]
MGHKLSLAIIFACLIGVTTMREANTAPLSLPLINSDFSSPAIVPPAAWINGAKAPGWTYAGNNLDGVGVQVVSWKPTPTTTFYWNGPDGSITQIIDPATYTIKSAGDRYILLASLGGQGSGTMHETSTLLVDGKAVSTTPMDIVNPVGLALAVSVAYTAKPEDVGKSIGVQFAWAKPETQMQAQVTNVSLAVSPAGTPAPDGSPADANLRYIGRWDKSDPAIYHSYWSGAYLRMKFIGSTVKVNLAAQTALAVSIDGAMPAAISAGPGEVDLARAPLKQGYHTIMLGADGQNAEVAFQGFVLAPGSVTLPIPARRLIEYIGDSITQGNTSYSWRSAEMLDCDHVQIAYSGCALSSGFGYTNPRKIGFDTQYFALKNFNHLADTPQAQWDFSYTPDIIVINLGQNEPEEKPDAFVASYARFIQAIHTKFPKTPIAAMQPYSGSHAADVAAAVARVKKAGDDRVVLINTSGWLVKEDFRDGVHPNDAGAIKAGFLLAEQLQPLLSK